jgi:hypothetical protein
VGLLKKYFQPSKFPFTIPDRYGYKTFRKLSTPFLNRNAEKVCSFGFYFYFKDMWGMSDEWTDIYELNEWTEEIQKLRIGTQSR